MNTYICEDNEKYKKFLLSHPLCNFAQSSEWAKVKSDWTSKVIMAEDEAGNIRGAMNILIRKIPVLGYTVMLSSRAPVCDPHDEEALSALMACAKQLAKKHKSYVLMLEPDVDIRDKEFNGIVRNMGFHIKNASKNFEGINPRFVYRKDIKGKTEEELIQSFHQKWRYNIRLSEKKGVEVKIGTRSDIPKFHKIMLETGVRDNFVTRSVEYFEKMYDRMAPEHLRLYLAYYEGQLIAGTITILYGKKCWYLYGASSNEHRKVMASYLLQWEAMKWALESGCDVYDFRGVSGDMDESNPLYGIYRFKKGFNGELVELIGEIDYVFKPFVYFMVEKGFKLLRSMRSKIYMLKHKNEVHNENTNN
ncbi:lipid II:glycine glycyltransferase (peptidoglycan interpeptide bridge formation enzyme) [Anaerobacterium chartisolvens]|uniref:Lipid II:glycine glycyltransferase (Peptidoglycan interpeptide bridge formation enzyme) n=1 Tax=Anaerobacterium chartisolvens TaxID=1297424 RepID=A0A369B7H3_9FIRM|nr:peptidoglycan bridge formation glycyltransferase FemA/FemB family protein [Anaerobacterium chartisolvens]RCX17470.1 lipid II:glycine glycyltransferase (peptidoglycan interpeptide bridge formation enzyme) [Anaerobacterium chartisolvens]